MGTTVDDRNAILATMGISEDDPGRTEILNNLGVMEDEDELRWFYQNQPDVLERLGIEPADYETEELEEKRPSLATYCAIVIWILLLAAIFW